MLQSIDSRMSSLDFTLGIISNVMSQIAGGFQTQDWEESTNTSETPVYIALNQIYEYVDSAFSENPGDDDWVNVGRFTMLLLTALLNFQSPSVSVGLETF